MAAQKHPLDEFAEQMEAAADRPVAAQEPSPDYWELHSSVDESVVGDYPQTEHCKPKILEEWGESGGLGADGFPAVPIPDQKLRSTARWTDVLNANLWSEGWVCNEKALAVFKQFKLGAFREYPVIVRDRKRSNHSLTYLFLLNDVPTTAIDFGRSEFYLADMLGSPKGPVAIESLDDWKLMRKKASDGELDGCGPFSKIAYKKLFFRRGHAPSVDYFTLERLGITVYISTRLKEAIESSGITGLEIKPNKRLFAAD